MMRIIYTGSFRFPDKDAASQRVLGIAKALRENGAEVMFCGWEQKPREIDRVGNYYLYQNFKYFSQSELDQRTNNYFQRIYFYLTLGNKTIKWLKQFVKLTKITHIIAYHGTSIFLLKLIYLCRKHDIKLVADCTEMYKPSHMRGGYFGLPNIDNQIRVKLIYPKIKFIIVISSYLKNLLNQRGCNTIVIPPLVDINQVKWQRKIDVLDLSSQYKKKIIYIGDPGEKDLFIPILNALNHLNKEKKLIQLLIVGMSSEEFSKHYFSKDLSYKNFVKCFGRVEMHEVPKYFHYADFSIIIRNNEEYANAGFPTKLVESLASGIPVMTNSTSDIKNYISTDFNGILLAKPTIEEIIYGLTKILNYNNNQIQKMQNNALFSAEKYFHFSNFTLNIDKYFNYDIL